MRIEQATAGAVRCEELLPDLPWDVIRPKSREKSPLKTLVDQHGQQAIADQIGCTQGFVSHVLTGRKPVSPRMALALERLYDVPVESSCPWLDWQRDDKGHVVGYLISADEISGGLSE
jgi:DNA-binding transcriptional regulator YdaS (Cro superfamily)